MLYRRCRAGGEGLFTCSLNELNRNLNFVKEKFGNPQRLGYVLVVCIRFSELILVSAYLQVLARGWARNISWAVFNTEIFEGLFKLAVVSLQQLVNRKLWIEFLFYSIVPGGRSRGRVQGVRTPLRLPAVFWYSAKKKTMWFIGVEVEQETSAPPPKKNPGSAPEFISVIRSLQLCSSLTRFFFRNLWNWHLLWN